MRLRRPRSEDDGGRRTRDGGRGRDDERRRTKEGGGTTDGAGGSWVGSKSVAGHRHGAERPKDHGRRASADAANEAVPEARPENSPAVHCWEDQRRTAQSRRDG